MIRWESVGPAQQIVADVQDAGNQASKVMRRHVDDQRFALAMSLEPNVVFH